MLHLMRRLPLQIVLGAFVFYGIAVGHGVTINSLTLTAKVAGWDWTPMVGHPLFWLLTLPLRLLPAAWVAPALNLFFAAVAAMTLGLLARSVQLLPWGCPLESQTRWVRTLPVLLACCLCGLEFNFWREAVASSGEMLAFLPLAAAVWLLLEFRVQPKISRLYWAAFVWGLGMAENWLMMISLPFFLAGTIWVKTSSMVTKANRSDVPVFVTATFWMERLYSLRFILLKFLGIIIGLSFIGFLIYAFLPTVNGLGSDSPWTLGQAWLASLKQTKITAVPILHKIVQRRTLLLASVIFCLVPILSCLMRQHSGATPKKHRLNPWADHHGRRSGEEIFVGIIQRTFGSGLELWFFRCLSAVLLLACLWLAFDPKTGLRQILQSQLEVEVSMPLLAFDYFNALGAAYLVGSFLLFWQNEFQLPRAGIPWRKWLASVTRPKLAVPVVATVLALITIGLASRNAPAIFSMNRHPLEGLGELAVASLPPGRCVILSEQPEKLAVFQAAQSHHHNRSEWLAVDIRALPLVEYRTWLERRHSLGWLTELTRHELSPVEVSLLLEQIAETNRLFFLHPSFGYLFEQFYLEPAGAIYELKLREKNSVGIPQLSRSVMDAEESFWTTVWQKELAPLISPTRQPLTGWKKKIERCGYFPAPRFQNQNIAEWYSLLLNSWGVTLQRQGRLQEAGRRFDQALKLNTNNYSAQINLACNTNLQSGFKQGLANLDNVVELLGNFRRLSLVMNNCGPFDEPVFCYLFGDYSQKFGLPQQAVEQLDRARILAPGVAAPELALAKLYAQFQLPDRINHIRTDSPHLSENSAVDLELALLEARSWLSQTNRANANSALQSVVQLHPDDAQIANKVIGVYLAFGDYDSASRLVKTQLSKNPDDVHILNSQAVIYLKYGNTAAAVQVLSHVLSLTNLPAARINRANTLVTRKDFAAAEADYHVLEQSGTDLGRVDFGLGTIAEQRQNTNLAVHYFGLCVSNTQPGTTLWRQASARLQALGADSSIK